MIMEEEITVLKQLLQDKEAELNSLKAEFEDLSERFKTAQHKHETQVEEDSTQQRNELAALRVTIEELDSKIKECRQENQQLADLLKTEKEKYSHMEKEFQELQAKVVYLQEDKATLENTARDLKNERDDLKVKVKTLEETATNEKEELRQEYEKKVENLERAMQETSESRGEIFTVRRENNDSTRVETGRTEALNSGYVLGQTGDSNCQYQEEVERLTKALEKRSEEIRWYETQTGKMQEEIGCLSERLRQKELEEIAEESEVEKTKIEIQILRETLEETDKQIQELNYKLNVSFDKSRDNTFLYDLGADKQEISTREFDILKKSLKEMGMEITSLSEKIKSEKETNMKMQKENEKNNREIKNKEKRLTSLKTEVSGLKTALTNERSKNADLEKKLTKLSREVDDRNKKLPNKNHRETPISRKMTAENEKLGLVSNNKQREANPETPVPSEDQAVQRLENENIYLIEKLNKMIADVELLSATMLTLKDEKVKLEEEMIQRESIIEDLTQKCLQNSELLDYAQSLKEENDYLSEKLNKMIGDVEMLAGKVTTILSEKFKLENDILQRESVIENLTAHYKQSTELLGYVQNLKKENESLNDKLEEAINKAEALEDRLAVVEDEKLRLENELNERETLIQDLSGKDQQRNDYFNYAQTLKEQNRCLSDKLIKIMGDVEIIASKMAIMQNEKLKLENEVMKRESIIENLTKNHQQNAELIEMVQSLREENQFLTEKINKIMGDVQILSSKIIEIRAEKIKLEEEVMERGKVIEELNQKYRENNGLLDLVREKEKENASLNQRLANVIKDVGFLSNKFIDLHDQKRQLELDALKREAVINDLMSKYNELEKALQSNRKEHQSSHASLVSAQIAMNISSCFQGKDDSFPHRLETNSSQDRISVISENQLFKSKNTKNYSTKFMYSSSMGNQDNQDSNMAVAPLRHTCSMMKVENKPKISKYLYSKSSRLPLSSSFRFDGDHLHVLDNSSTKNSKSSSRQPNKIDKTISFNKIVYKPSDLELKTFNLKEGNILGRSAFFLIYGSKRSDKKVIKHNLVHEVVEILKTVSQKNTDKVCKLIFRIQDEKLFKKLEASKNFTALDQYREHQEFLLGSDQKGKALEEFIAQFKQLDTKKVHNMESTSIEKSPNKEIFIEFLMQKRDDAGGVLNNCSNCTTRTKIMIVTTNIIKEVKELEGLTSVDSVIDLVLNDNKDTERRLEIQTSVPVYNVEKFLIMSIHPGLQTSKAIVNTITLASKLEEIEKAEKDGRHHTEKKINPLPSPKKVDKWPETIETTKNSTKKKEKFADLKILPPSEIPKNKTKDISSELHLTEKCLSTKTERIVPDNQKLVQQIEDYSKYNPAGKGNMKRLLGALTHSTSFPHNYKKPELKSSFSGYMSALVTPDRYKRSAKTFDFDQTKKEIIMTM